MNGIISDKTCRWKQFWPSFNKVKV